MVFVMLITISSKRDLSVFMKLGSIGTSCVLVLIVFVIYEGIRSLTDTKYNFDSTPPATGVAATNELHNPVTLFMFNFAVAGFGQLMGLLSTGFFIHQCSLPII